MKGLILIIIVLFLGTIQFKIEEKLEQDGKEKSRPKQQNTPITCR